MRAQDEYPTQIVIHPAIGTRRTSRGKPILSITQTNVLHWEIHRFGLPAHIAELHQK